MSKLKNRVMLMGHLGGDPEIKEFESGKVKGQFSLATTETYKDGKGDWHKLTEWHNVIGWGAMAKKMEKQLKKGSSVIVEGKLQHRSFETESGEKKYITEVNIDTIEVLNKPSVSNEETSKASAA